MASGLNIKPSEEQVNTLVYLMGEKADEIFLSFRLTEEDKVNYDQVIKSFEDYFVVKHNIIYERAKFNLRCQEEGEKVEDFITSLYILSENCNYGNLREEMIRDRIVVGVRDKRISEKLQLESELTVVKAIQTVRQSEAIHKQQQELGGQIRVNTNTINTMKALKAGRAYDQLRHRNDKTSLHREMHQTERNKTIHSSNRKETEKLCRGCGSSVQHQRMNCPAQGKQCRKCKKWNHFSRVCQSSVTKFSTVNDVHSSDNIMTFLGNVNNNKKSYDDRWTAAILVNGNWENFLIDTGSPVNAIPFRVYRQKFKSMILTPSDRVLKGPTGEKLLVKGKFEVNLKYGDKNIKSELYVINYLRSALLSLSTCEDLNIIHRVNTIEKCITEKSDQSKVDAEKEFPSIFQGLGCLQGQYEIKLNSECKPYAINSARRVPIPLMEKLQAKLDEMVKLKVIKPVNEPTEWCAPAVIVLKPDGDIRLCVDLTKLNNSVQREIHPMPTTEHTLAQLGNAKYFSILDKKAGFWQIKLAPKSHLLTTFLTPFGRYCFLRMPFGISSAPEHFQRKMQQLLRGLKGVICHMDDILVYGSTMEEHDVNLRATLKRLEDGGATLNKDKCKIGVTSVKFLGHLIDHRGIHPEYNKVESITKFPEPTCVAELRRFLGLVNYLGKFVPHLSTILHPLNQLLRNNTEFLWGPSQSSAFNKVKELLTSAPILGMFDSRKQTIISADASSYGIGAVLLQQEEEDKIKVISYASRSLSEGERRYAQIEKEGLAIIWACERFNDYITGLQVHIETDHKPLIPIFTSKDLNELTPRLQRLKMRLMRFNYKIKYTPGKQLYIADALSRHPLKVEEKTELEEHLDDFVATVISEMPASDRQLKRLREYQTKDEDIQMIIKYTIEEWPARNVIPERMRKYWNDRYSFSINDGLLLFGTRIVIPLELRQEIIEKLHHGHLGIVKSRARLRQSVWWPGCSKELEKFVSRCPVCTQTQLPRRRLKTIIPTSRLNLQPKMIDGEKLQEKEEIRQQLQEGQYNRRYGVRQKDNLHPKDIVWIRDTKSWGTIKQQGTTPRSYIVETKHNQLRRNSFHLTKAKIKSIPYEPEEADYPVMPEEKDTHIVSSSDTDKENSCQQGENRSELPVKPEVTTSSPYKTRSGRTVRLPLRFRQD